MTAAAVSSSVADLPAVDIDASGLFKYVLLTVSGCLAGPGATCFVSRPRTHTYVFESDSTREIDATWTPLARCAPLQATDGSGSTKSIVSGHVEAGFHGKSTHVTSMESCGNGPCLRLLCGVLANSVSSR